MIQVVVLCVQRRLRVVWSSMDSLVALQTQSGRAESGTGGALKLHYCDVSKGCSVVSFIGSDESLTVIILEIVGDCGSESASDFCHWLQPQVLSAGCPHHWRFSFAVSLYCLLGQPAFSCWAQALHTTVDRACDDHPSWWHFPPIAAGPWWVWPQSWYTLHCPGPWGLWYGPASRCQLWNGGHTYESSPGSWYACGTVSKSHNHTCPVQHVPACVWWRD